MVMAMFFPFSNLNQSNYKSTFCPIDNFYYIFKMLTVDISK